ncbi:hypothetical protein B0T14DRAFT_532069 [Immersiella caudata]|uniref:Uncharacterized protein n=1 Tax=Immersiella caudata TaxID=314043 RepID=A0AA39TJC2_9PEZI|nr:hypothetical protein B0T14DRAFT_532069 [Immersiella caudata]
MYKFPSNLTSRLPFHPPNPDKSHPYAASSHTPPFQRPPSETPAMATINISSHVATTFTKGLNTLLHILDAAEAHAKKTGADVNNDYLPAHPNATKNVKAHLDRLSGSDAAPWEDTEKTWEEFRSRIAKAKKYIEGVDLSVIDKRLEEGVKVDHPFGATALHIAAKDSVLGHGIPNFYFHLATAYSILRSKGVPVGKKDWILEFFRPEVEFP